MPWGFAIAGAATLGAAAIQSDAAGDAAGQASAGARAGDAAYRQYNQPFYDAGTSALSRLSRLDSGDFSAFTESPDYQFTLDQGIEARNRAASSRGSLNSGGQDVDLLRYGQGLATQNYGNYRSGLERLAGLGQSSAQGLGGSASAAASNIGQAQAQGTIGSANAWGNAASGLAGLGGQYFGQRQSTYGSNVGPVTRQQFTPDTSFNVPAYQAQGNIYG